MMKRIVSLLLLTLLTLSATSQTYRRYVKTTGRYTDDGKSWSSAKNNLQDAINDLAAEMREAGVTEGGQVWVAAGTYTPTESTDRDGASSAFTAFKMLPGISVYGGFPEAPDDNTDNSLEGREMLPSLDLTVGGKVRDQSYAWRFKHVTLLSGNLSSIPVEHRWDSNQRRFIFTYPGSVYHVVWFATNGFDANGAALPLGAETVLDGVTVEYGSASGGTDAPRHTRRGGGIYLAPGGVVRGCVVRKCYAEEMGGGVFADHGGRVEQSYIHENATNGVNETMGYGGGVCLHTEGVFDRSVIINNFARNGGGAALYNPKAYNAAEQNFDTYVSYRMVGATSVIANNTASNEAGGLYFENGGLCNQLTVAYNECYGEINEQNDRVSGQSGGVYVYDRAGLMNSVLWGNLLRGRPGAEFYKKNVTKTGLSAAQQAADLAYVTGCAVAQSDQVDWNGVYVDFNNNLEVSNFAARKDEKSYPYFAVPCFYPRLAKSELAVGVNEGLDEDVYLQYTWNILPVSALREKGAPLIVERMPAVADDPVLGPILLANTDILGHNFNPRSDVGAYHSFALELQPADIDGGKHLFVDPDGVQFINENNLTEVNNDGSSWNKAIISLNAALNYCRDHYADDVHYYIHVKEGKVIPFEHYMSSSTRSATIRMVSNVSVLGGYPADLTGTDRSRRDPQNHPTHIDANINARNLNAYHCITFANVRNATLDGFHIVNAQTSPEARVPFGAGILVTDMERWSDPADATEMTIDIRNCVIENCSVDSNADYGDGAALAVSARRMQRIGVRMENCVIANNSSLHPRAEKRSLIYAEGGQPVTVDMDHCTVVHNAARLADSDNPQAAFTMKHSWYWANANTPVDNAADLAATDLTDTQGVTLTDCLTDADLALDAKAATYPACQNPTRNIGAADNNAGYNTLYGGHSVWIPLAMNPVVNRLEGETATDLTTRVTRNRGGRADLGAYENSDLPARGRVYYVRTDGSDDNDGLSWQTSFATIRKATQTAAQTEIIGGAKAEVWVAAGTYRQNPVDDKKWTEVGGDPYNGSPNCFEILEGVNVYGGFPAKGSPSMAERHPLLSQYVYNNTGGEYADADYETILEPLTQTEAPGTVHRVLGQPDRFNPFHIDGKYNSAGQNSYQEVGPGNGNYIYNNEATYEEVGAGRGDYVYHDAPYYAIDDKAENSTLLLVKTAGWYKIPEKQTITGAVKYGRYLTTYKYRSVSGYNGNGKPNDYIEYVDAWGGGDTDVVETTDKKNNKIYEFTDGTTYWKWTSAGVYGIPDDKVTEYATHAWFEPGSYDIAAGYGNAVLHEPGYEQVGAGRGDYTLNPPGWYEVEWGQGTHILNNQYDYNLATQWDGFTLRHGYIDSYYVPYLRDQDKYTGVASGARNGGAGAVLYKNVTLKNCIITLNKNGRSQAKPQAQSGTPQRGGAVYTDLGTIVNCYILNNQINDAQNPTSDFFGDSYGGGCYMYRGTMYNTVIAHNKSYGNSVSGAGIFLENAEFYNNTIVGNECHGSANSYGAGVSIYNDGTGGSKNLVIYNSIITGNTTTTQNATVANRDIHNAYTSTTINCYNSLTATTTNIGTALVYHNCRVGDTEVFADYAANNYRLSGDAKGKTAQNFGENFPEVYNRVIDLWEYTDMDYTERIKDCTVDAGAFEYNGAFDIRPTLDNVPTSDTYGAWIYYVTPAGSAVASASSPAEAACNLKLQQVLDAAGRAKADNPENRYIVKLAADANGYDYTPTRQTLAPGTDIVRTDDPRAYALQVPCGVELWGGYNLDFTSRDVTRYITRLRAVEASRLNDQYHALTFTRTLFDTDQHPLTDDRLTKVEDRAVADGLYLTGGRADGSFYDIDRCGGGAVVTGYAHVRNCIVENNSADENGGGLYLENGALVSGTLVRGNTAYGGGGVYVSPLSNETAAPARIYTSSIVNNISDGGQGGGLSFGLKNVIVNSTVVWGNEAAMNSEVSGNINAPVKGQYEYPFSYCAVEQTRMPGLNNFAVEVDNARGTRFDLDEGYNGLTKMSLLLGAGMPEKLYTELIEGGDKLTAADFRATARRTGYRNIDIGARAFDRETFPLNVYIPRIFVSHSTEPLPDDFVTAMEATGDARITTRGTSFYYPFVNLTSALDYIKHVRNADPAQLKDLAGNAVTEPQNTAFEIYVAAGEYYPYSDVTADTEVEDVYRNASFNIPSGVILIGGLKGDEMYYQSTTDDLTVGDRTFLGRKTVNIIQARELFDQNGNNIAEPWEFRYSTYFSGVTNNSASKSYHAFHVFFSDNDEKFMGRIPTVGRDGVTTGNPEVDANLQQVVIDGAVIRNGDATRAEGTSLHPDYRYRGGAVCVAENDRIALPVPALILRHCLLQNNTAGQGGAIYTDGTLKMYGTRIVRCAARRDESVTTDVTGRGGAVYMRNMLRMVNSLIANNEADDRGMLYLGSITTPDMPEHIILNSNFVRNRAAHYPGIYAEQRRNAATPGNYVANTLFWGNRCDDASTDLVLNLAEGTTLETAYDELRFCAYEPGKWKTPTFDGNLYHASRAEALAAAVNNNVHLSADNFATDGPGFDNPAAEPGLDGYRFNASYAVRRQSVLTDMGSGYLEQRFVPVPGTDRTTPEFIPGDTPESYLGGGIYSELAAEINAITGGNISMPYGEQPYMQFRYIGQSESQPMHRISRDPAPTHGMTNIDIGVYEYQHVNLVPLTRGNVDILFVRPFEDGSYGPSDGMSWRTGTSDLQRAIETLLVMRNGHKKKIYMSEGDYTPVYVFGDNKGFTVDVAAIQDGGESKQYDNDVRTLTIMGGYASTNLDRELMVRDTKYYPTRLIAATPATRTLFEVKNAKRLSDKINPTPDDPSHETSEGVKGSAIPVYLDGLVLENPYGTAIGYKDVTATVMPSTSEMPKFGVNRCVVRLSGGKSEQPAVDIQGGESGFSLIANSLFHSNTAAPVSAERTRMVNNTLALNGAALQLTPGTDGEGGLYNSVLWHNGTDEAWNNITVDKQYNAVLGLPATDASHNDPLTAVNNDAIGGPNFVRPDETAVTDRDKRDRDFSFNVTARLVNCGDNTLYDDLLKTMERAYDETDSDYSADNMIESNDFVPYDRYIEKDIAASPRFFLAPGIAKDDNRVDRGAYELAKPLIRVLYVDPSNNMDRDGASWETAYPSGGLQAAIDLVAVFHHIDPQHRDGYVFVKQGETARFGQAENITLRPGVKTYGSFAQNETTGHTVTADNEVDITALLDRRRGVLEVADGSTVIAGVTTDGDGAGSVLDGFQITGGDVVNIGQSATLRNALVRESVGTIANSGLIYNTLIEHPAELTFTGEGDYINVTAYAPALQNTPSAQHRHKSIFTTSMESFAPYVDDMQSLRFQLHEKSTYIDRKDEASAEVLGRWTTMVDYAKDFDILGNPRRLNEEVDFGAFETWRVPAGATWTTRDEDRYHPTEGSVVYLEQGAKFVLGQSRNFRPGYFLLGEGASLYAGETNVLLSRVGVEKQWAEGDNLFAVPFDFSRIYPVRYDEVSVDNLPAGEKELTPVIEERRRSFSRYDGAARAAGLYRYHESASPYWVEATDGGRSCEGYVIPVDEEGLYRIDGRGTDTDPYIYVENGTDKSVTLTQHNLTPTDGTALFTYKENMGWNLFGLPYLVSDYAVSDENMTLPRILYPYDNATGTYDALESWSDDAPTLSAGDAVFTQTAVLKNLSREQLTFARPVYTAQAAARAAERTGIALSGVRGTDFVTLRPDESVTGEREYTYGSDGLKLMAERPDAPQLYAANEIGTRFALMGGLDPRRPVTLTARLPEEGTYRLALPETARAAYADYGTVMLHDKVTGRTVDLLTTDYEFSALAADEGRAFTLTFGGQPLDTAPRYGVAIRDHVLTVTGLTGGEHLTVHDAAGRRIVNIRNEATTYRRQLPDGVYIVRVNEQTYKCR